MGVQNAIPEIEGRVDRTVRSIMHAAIESVHDFTVYTLRCGIRKTLNVVFVDCSVYTFIITL
jgi:hypothetical protein